MKNKVLFKRCLWSFIPINLMGWAFVFFMIACLIAVRIVILEFVSSEGVQDILGITSVIIVFIISEIFCSRHI
jgi:hypothetical protein